MDGDVTTFVWDWASGLPEMLSDGDNLYLVGHDTLGQFADDEWAYYLPDALGSVRQVADSTGAVVSSREWTPFGVEVGAGQQGGLGYTGEWWDSGAELLYLRARWYAQRVGRFTSKDPFPTANRWLYADANPLLLTDPTGYFSEQLIADTLGLSDFKQVARWFDQLEEDIYWWAGLDEAKRWGFLALLQAADVGDQITGLTLGMAGRKSEIDMGTFVSCPCATEYL